MKFTFLILFALLILTACQSSNKKASQNTRYTDAKNAEQIKTANWQLYDNQEYHFNLKLPAEWETQGFNTGEKYPVINFYPADEKQKIDFPITVHANAGVSFIAVYPKGYGIELPAGKSRKPDDKFNLTDFSINAEQSKMFMLENNQEWGYFIVPSSPPDGWTEHAFIFVQLAANNFEIKCFDGESGDELEMDECDPMTGDVIKRTGEINQQEKQVIKEIIGTFNFDETSSGEANNSSGGEIQINQPASGATVSSPIKIKGKAKGSWYFEAEFTVALMQNGEEMAETIAKAQGDWMTSDFVPFSATMEIPDDAESGKAFLVFKNSNPSGKPELNKTYRLPVEIGGQ